MANREHYKHLLNFLMLTGSGLDMRDVIDALRDSNRLDDVDNREDESVADKQTRYAERTAQEPRSLEEEAEAQHREKCRASLSSKHEGWETLSDDSRAMLVEELYMTERLLFGQLTLLETGQYAQKLLLRGAALAAIRSAKNRNIEEQCALLQSAALAYEAASKP